MSDPRQAAVEAAAQEMCRMQEQNGGPPWEWFPENERTGRMAKETFRNSAHAAIAAYERALWRPIAEAPRDGTRVIGWGGCDTAIVSWQDHPEGGAWEDDYDAPWEVSHFRPLPTGPEEV